MSGANEMSRQIKVLAANAGDLEFGLQNPQGGWGASTLKFVLIPSSTHTRTHQLHQTITTSRQVNKMLLELPIEVRTSE